MRVFTAIDFLYRRIESSETMAEKERVLELFWEESKKIRKRKNLHEINHLRELLVAIRDKYCEKSTNLN